MTKRLCLIHANCQGEPLLERLRASPEFAETYDAVVYTNYIKEPVPDEVLARTDLFLYQYLGPRWDDLASDVLASKLPEGARSLCIPNMFFMGYWPLWSGRQGFDYRDRFLDDLLESDLGDEEILTLYLRSDPMKKYNIANRLGMSLRREIEREARTPVRYLEFIEINRQARRLFNTVNHPCNELMKLSVRGILERLDMEPADEEGLEELGEPFAEFEQPIHPRIAALLGYGFAGPDTEYNVYGLPMTHARYTAKYIEARRAGVTDFIGYLQGVVQ